MTVRKGDFSPDKPSSRRDVVTILVALTNNFGNCVVVVQRNWTEFGLNHSGRVPVRVVPHF